MAATHSGTRAQLLEAGATRRFLRLLRLDAVRRSLRWSVPIALAMGLLIRLAAGENLWGWEGVPFYRQAEFIYVFIQLWLAVLFAVIIAHFNSRCSSLSLGLPLSPRELWLSRVVAVAGAGVIPIAIFIAATARANPSSSAGLDLPLLSIGARTAAGFVLAVVLFQLPSPRAHRIGGGKAYAAYVALVSAALMMYSIFTPEPWAFTAIPLVVAGAIATVVVFRLPVGFDYAGPGETGSAATGVLRHGSGAAETPFPLVMDGSAPIRGLRLLRIVWRENLNTWPTWMMTLLIFVTVWALSASHYMVKHPLYDYASLTMWCWIFIGRSVRRLGRIDHYPISRSFVFYSVIAAMAIPAGAGMLTSYIVDYRLKDPPPASVCYCEHTVRVPFDAWEIAWNGWAPEVEAPWGETYTPHAARLVDFWTPVAVYNPFEPGKESSPRFTAFQIDRAVERVHGEGEASPPVVALAADTAFVNAIDRGEYTVESSLRKGSELRSRTQAIIIMIFAVLFVVVNAVWWTRYRPGADIAKTRWFAILFFGIPYALLILLIVTSVRGVVNDWSILAFQMVTLRSISDAIPLGTGLLWVATGAVCVACLVFLQRRYAKAEAPTQRSGKSLLSEY